MRTITPRQMQILRFIRDFRQHHGYSPTMQEIGDALSLAKVTAFEHVTALARKGLLTRGPKHHARSLEVNPDFAFPDEETARLPLVGRIAAGRPIEAIEDYEEIDLEEMFSSRSETFVLEVTGESMIDEGIRDGDYVICERRNTPRNGETVVAVLDDGEATLKKFYRERDRIRLQPANPAFQPIYARNVEIRGVVIGVIRRV